MLNRTLRHTYTMRKAQTDLNSPSPKLTEHTAARCQQGIRVLVRVHAVDQERTPVQLDTGRYPKTNMERVKARTMEQYEHKHRTGGTKIWNRWTNSIMRTR